MTLEDYLKHTKETQNNCLEWQRCFNSDGYPRAGNTKTPNIKVHREVFFLVNGYYPEVVRHTCDNIKCINPSHLEGGNQLDNVEDRHKRGRTNSQYSEDLINSVLFYKDQGFRYKEIADQLNIKPKRVDSILYWYRSRKDS